MYLMICCLNKNYITDFHSVINDSENIMKIYVFTSRFYFLTCPKIWTIGIDVVDLTNASFSTLGWYQGERIRDQERGWFPGSFTVEISSTHVRARNLRQRYRLLAISGSLLDELKREKERYEKEEKKKDRRRTLTMKEVISSQALS